MRDKLKSLKAELRKVMNLDIVDVAKCLLSVVTGYYNYFAIHDNLKALSSFSYQLGRTWFRTIRGSSQRRKMTW
ncbi:MAG: hypothetical protein LBR53_04860 [Deltaproteobacteria bacterium]|jgi:hypothetical protein|nr:hypothetical protein [Deltaproteobacteria bacterium]